MKNRLIILRGQLNSSYWFIPGLMALLAAAASIFTIELDKAVGRDLGWVTGLVYVDSPEGARAVLSTVASSMITVAGVVFSLTMVVLSLSSQQYGPLVLRQYMGDRVNQLVLGIFTSTFIYCLLILRTIRGVENSVIPHISVLIGLGLAIVSLAFLIYFIHHVAESIQSTSIIARISENLMDGITDIFPTKFGQEFDAQKDDYLQQIVHRFEKNGLPVHTSQSGYLQMVDETQLFQIASSLNVIVQIEEQPGHFFVKGDLLAHVLPLQDVHNDTHETIASEIEEAFTLGVHRTANQDIVFLLLPLVSIGVRSLSPGINDPFTAIMCLDRLTEALSSVLQRSAPSMYRYSSTNHLRVISESVPFKSLFHTSFDQIRRYGHGDLRVVIHLIKCLGELYGYIKSASHKRLLRQYAIELYQESRAQFKNPFDLRAIDQAYAETLEQLEQEETTERPPHPSAPSSEETPA